MARSSTASNTELYDLVRQVEARGNGAFTASILRLEGGRLYHEAAPGLPAEYRDAIDGSAAGPKMGSCGTAAYRGHPIYVPDIAEDALWAGVPDIRDLALDAGFRACWSVPVLDPDRRVLGTLSIYHREPRGPTAAERRLLAEAAQAASELLGQRALATA